MTGNFRDRSLCQTVGLQRALNSSVVHPALLEIGSNPGLTVQYVECQVALGRLEKLLKEQSCKGRCVVQFVTGLRVIHEGLA